MDFTFKDSEIEKFSEKIQYIPEWFQQFFQRIHKKDKSSEYYKGCFATLRFILKFRKSTDKDRVIFYSLPCLSKLILDKINNVESPTKHATYSNDYIMPLRKCIIELIERNIERGHSSHEENKIIGMELINAGFSNRNIHFIFESIYNEPGRDWGWYTDDPDKAGHIIENMREKALNRYSKDKLIQMKVCESSCSCV